MSKLSLKKSVLIALFTAMALGAAACNTIEGLGKDVERGGEKLQNAAN